MVAASLKFLDCRVVVGVEAHGVANLVAVRFASDYPDVALKGSVAAVDFFTFRKLVLDLLYLFFCHGFVRPFVLKVFCCLQRHGFALPLLGDSFRVFSNELQDGN